MKRRPCLTLSIALLLPPALGAPAALPAQGPAVLRGVDVYRSVHLDTETLYRKRGPLLDSIAAAVSSQDMETLGERLGVLGRWVREQGRFAFIDLSPIQYFENDTTVWYLTVDVVDSTDLGRLDFDPAPTGQVTGLDDLLEAWRAFEAAGWERRAFWSPGEECPAYHCLFSFQDPALAPFAHTFREGAAARIELLERLLRDDSDAEDRATAAFIMAHHPDRDRVVRHMVERMRDPSSLVRNNATRVLAFLAQHGDPGTLPLAPFLRLMDGPSTTDRNKALVVLEALVGDPVVNAVIRAQAATRLVELLALRQPNNHDYAYSILKEISGEDFGEGDVAAWRRWAAQAASKGRDGWASAFMRALRSPAYAPPATPPPRTRDSSGARAGSADSGGAGG